MDGHSPAALRKEYLDLVLASIRRYAAAGHALSFETSMLPDRVRVSFDFDPRDFSPYFAHMGGEVTSETPRT